MPRLYLAPPASFHISSQGPMPSSARAAERKDYGFASAHTQGGAFPRRVDQGIDPYDARWQLLKNRIRPRSGHRSFTLHTLSYNPVKRF